MDVVRPTHRPRVAELLRDFVDGAEDVGLGLLLGCERPEIAQRTGGEHRPGPGPEVLRSDGAARDVAEVLVDVTGVDRLALAVVVQILKELLTGELLTALYDPRDAPV